MADVTAKFSLNNENLNATFDLSEENTVDAIFKIDAAGTTWGSIDGTLSNQTDLYNALNLKADKSIVEADFEALSDTVAENYTTLDNKIDSVQSDLSGDISALSNIVTSNNTDVNNRIDTTNSNLSNLQTTVNNNNTAINNRVNTLETSFDADIEELNTHLSDLADTVSVNYTDLSGQISGTNVNLTSLSTTVSNNNTAINQKVDTLETSLTGDINTLSGTVSSNYTTLDTKIDNTKTEIEGDISALSGTVTSNYNDLSSAITTSTSTINARIDSEVDDLNSAIITEASTRENADNALQSQIDAITASSDVVDIVGTYEELQAYDTSHLQNNDIVKVLSDESRNYETTYYRWVITDGAGAWSFIGAEGPYYTKSEADSEFVPQTRYINNYPLSDNIYLTASDVDALPDTTVIGDGVLTLQVNGENVGTFNANSTYDDTINIEVPDSATWGNIDGLLSNQTDLQDALNTKQDVLTAGTGITIENNVISATASGNFVTLDTEQYITAPKAFLGEYTMIAPAYDTETGTDPTLYFGVDAYNGITGLSTGTKGLNFTNQNSTGDTANMIVQENGILSCYSTKDSGHGTEAISQFYQTPNQITASAANVGVNIYGPDNQVYISTNMASFTFTDNGLTLPTQSISTSYGNDIAVTYGLLTGKLAEKQDTISDIATIRSGAALGATALQPNDNISELTNDAGYITNTALSGYATETWVTNQGFASNTDLTNGLAIKQNTLTAGTNIQINNNVISATDTTYSAGTGISIIDGVISNTRTTLEWGNLTGTLSDQTDLQDELDLKANTADVNIALNDKADTDLSNTASILSDSFLFKILPDWDNGIIMGLPEKPVSTTTTTFTAPANGICNISGMRSPSGNSLNIYVNNKHIANWAAYSAFSCSILFPVSKGDIVLAKTDSTSATWVLNIKAFYPLKGAN